MNRFRTKKKAKEAESLVRISTDSDGPPLAPVKSSKTFRRGKKTQEPEPKLEIDLATALPSSDDFRTSLLMSGLSARFSMLREQDDPKSKIGKASDDSVLFPKRQSRLNDFGFQSHGLSDIAEVSSISGSIRPPFAFGRADSFHATDGYGTDDDSTHTGSIMNRSKPGEGNNLFGGRQKIYKIPVNALGASKATNESTGGGMGGRALYGDDVSQSAFQRLREREREQERQERINRQEREEMDTQSSRPSSPPPSGYNRNRETSSTTSSAGPSNTRISTAATSVTSQRTPSLSGAHTPVTPNLPNSGTPTLERSTTKIRRLYETGLDQHLHEQQFSAMSRIDTLTRQRTLGAQTPPLGISPTAGPLMSERWDRHQLAGKASMPNLRAASPPPSGAGTFDFAVRQNNAPESKHYGMSSPPLSPPMSEHDDPISLALQPNDRGKATALGAFSKPVQPYDENKYSQRQLQMQQGRETPPLRKNSPPRAFPSRQQMNRARADSNATFASGSSRSNSSAQRQFLPQERIPEILRTENFATETESMGAGTFLSDGSSQGSLNDMMQEPSKTKTIPRPLDLYAKYRQDQPMNLERPPESEHPANRKQTNAEDLNGATESLTQLSTTNLQPNSAPQPPADSPTLGPTIGLSGIREHLRTDSNSSSIYGGVPSASMASRFPYDSTEPLPQNEYTTKNNPWGSDDWDNDYYKDTNFGHDGPADMTRKNEVLPTPLSARSPNIDAIGQSPRKPSWEREMESRHTRDGSSATQKERQDFQNELASRRRRVQENLKSFVETESKSESPMPGSEWSKEHTLIKNNPLELLKTKSSKGSLIGRNKEPGQTKAMKMLGIGQATMTSSSSPNKQSFEESSWQQEEEEMLRGVTKPPVTSSPPQTRAFRQARRDAQRDREKQIALRHQQNQQRMAAEASELEWSNPRIDNQPRQRAPSGDRVPPNIRTGPRTQSRERRQHPPPVTHSFNTGSGRDSKDSTGTSRSESRPPSRSSRDRSGSDTSGGRSKSRNGRYRDDLAKAMAEGTSSSSQGYNDDLEVPSARFAPKSPGIPGIGFAQSPIPSPMLGSNSRVRSNSNLVAAGYFDGQKSPMMLHTGGEASETGFAPRPSPTAPFVVNATPALVHAAPVGSGANTPTAQGFQNQGGVPTHRKRSINKSDISEPRFISSTSRVTTVNLPPGSSLQNGADVYAPPIPPVNPRRRQTRAIFGNLMGKKDEYDEIHSMPSATQSTEEMSMFSADEGDMKSRTRQKLRKSSSEGGNLNARARQAAQAAPSPAVPAFPAGAGSPPRLGEGGMF